MLEFLFTALIAFIVLLSVSMLVNFCRRRLRTTPHGLTGMCHRHGGAMCPSCAADPGRKPRP